MPAAVFLAVAAGFVALQAIALLAMGRPAICECGYVEFWHANPSGPETSQHLIDWYTFTHVPHGFGFYLLLWVLVPRLSFSARLAIAIGLEAGWEVIENTPFIIDRYRQTAVARGYYGDSIINSLVDTLATAIGFVLARILPVWSSVLLVVAAELILALAIRDNLTLNIVQLIYPSEIIDTWQSGQ
jgi:hypothetical protein